MNARIRTMQIPCDPGHDVVYGLAAGRGSEIYLAPSNEFCPGLCAVVLAFDTVTERFRPVLDVREMTGFDPSSGLMPHSKIHLCLCSTSQGRLFAATHFTAPAIGQTNFEAITAYRGKYPGCFILEYDPESGRAISHGLVLKGEGARIACLDEINRQYYFLSYPRNHLYRYDYDRRALFDLGRPGQENAFGLEVDERGDVYTSDDLGRIIRYSYRKNRLEELDFFVPLCAGRKACGNYIRRMTKGMGGSFYGFANKGMRLFRLDPREERIEDFGVIFGADRGGARAYPRLPPAKAVVQTDPRTLWIAFGGDGVYSDQDPVPNLVKFDLIDRVATDCGKFTCEADGLPAWIPQCALSVPGANAVFFGMQQTVGQLRLWRVDLNAESSPVAPVPGEWHSAHLTTVQGKPFGASIEGADALPFVREGRAQMHELGWAGEDRVIPAEETSVAALCFVGPDTLYGMTSGRRAHLFSFRPYAQNRFTENYEVHPWDLGIAVPETTFRCKLFPDLPRGRLLLAAETATYSLVSAFALGSEKSRYRGSYHSVPHWGPVEWAASPFLPVAKLGAESACFGNLTYVPRFDALLSTTADGRLSAAGWDGTARPLEFSAPLSCPGLMVVGADRLFAVGRAGGAWLLHLQNESRLTVEAHFPAPAGPPSCLAVDDAQKRVAVGGLDGTIEIIALDPLSAPVALRLPQRWKVRALAWAPSGQLYGFYGGDDGIGEAFRADPVAGTIGEIGILQVSSQPRYWMCHRCDALALGQRGEAYYGESDRIAHLFVVS